VRLSPVLVAAVVILVLLVPAGPSTGQPSITLEPLFTSVPMPHPRSLLGLTNAGDGSGRLFILTQQGEILIHAGGQILPTPFLDIRTEVLCCGEQGLLGLAFHPQYETNGFFFVYYTDPTGANVVARYSVWNDANVADSDSRAILFSDLQPGANHNGGQLAFGPDNLLYIAKGDGGASNNGQNLSTRLGKILRIRPSLGEDPPFYTVPSDNPFAGGARPEIWAYGFRNPWRFSFDRLTGDLFIGDVGENRREEVDFEPADSPGGRNYGWRLMEGTLCFNPDTGCNPTGSLVLPILEYDHLLGCSITGGFRYRGTASPSLAGVYFYADFCSGRIWAATESGGNWTSAQALDTALSITSFGESEDGEVYVVHRGGAVHRIVGAGGGPDLVIEGLGLSAGSVAPGGQVTVSYNVANRGTGSLSGVYTDRLHLSTNATLGGDVVLGTSHGHNVPLPPNTTHAHSQAVTIPAGTAPGNYFILVQADALSAVAESSEGNNVTAIPVTVSGGGPDLVIEGLGLSAGSVAPGGQVTVSYNVANRGTGSLSGVYTDRLHLSTNATLGGDVVLGTSHGHNVPLPPNSTHAHSQAVTIPAGTTPGNYFILVQADALSAVTESSEGNNITAIPVTVSGGGPDLVIEGLGLSAGSVAPGGQVTVSYNVANRGIGSLSGVYTDRLHLSTNTTRGGDVVLGTSHGHNVPLPPNSTHAHSQAVTIPAGTAPGNYFILVQADALSAVTESSEGNNVTAIPVTVGAGGRPDLVIEGLGLSAGSVAPGGRVTVSYNVANRGTGSLSGVYTDRLHRSTNTILGAADTLLGQSHGHNVPLPPNSTHAHSQAVTIPAGTTPGNYFILVQADALSAVTESNEGNNVRSVSLTVTAP
jgi:subtilase family serine protease